MGFNLAFKGLTLQCHPQGTV